MTYPTHLHTALTTPDASDASTMMRIMEASRLPMDAVAYREALVLLTDACRAASTQDLWVEYWRCAPGVETLVENEFFERTGRLLSEMDRVTAEPLAEAM